MENSDVDSDKSKTMEAFDLLEESWFFNNMFDGRTKMLRCFSDPCSSPSFSQDVLPIDSSKRFQCKGSRIDLVRAPFLPQCIWRQEKEKVQERKMNCTDNDKVHERKSKLMGESSSSSSSSQSNLRRTPSLPSSFGRKEVIEEENDSDTRMSNLIRQAMGNSPDILPPRQSSNYKAMTNCCSMQGYKPPRILEVDANNNNNGVQESRRQHPNQKKTLRRSFSHLAVAEVQGNKDSGLGYDKVESSPAGAIKMAPAGLKVRRPSYSEAWLAQNRPPLPDCFSKNSAQDMKEQLKFWARAVATNVRQEC